MLLQNTCIHTVTSFTEMTPGVWLTGPIPRQSGEDCGGDFYHDEACLVPDRIPEEIALLSSEGILLTGCCHAGIINTVEYCRKCRPEIKIRTIAGGLHLRHANVLRLNETAAYLREQEIRDLVLLHCTGAEAVAFLREKRPDFRIRTPLPGESIEL